MKPTPCPDCGAVFPGKQVDVPSTQGGSGCIWIWLAIAGILPGAAAILNGNYMHGGFLLAIGLVAVYLGALFNRPQTRPGPRTQQLRAKPVALGYINGQAVVATTKWEWGPLEVHSEHGDRLLHAHAWDIAPHQRTRDSIFEQVAFSCQRFLVCAIGNGIHFSYVTAYDFETHCWTYTACNEFWVHPILPRVIVNGNTIWNLIDETAHQLPFKDWVEYSALSSNGKQLALVKMRDFTCFLDVLEIETGDVLCRQKCNDSILCWSTDDRHIISANGGSITIWDSARLTCISTHTLLNKVNEIDRIKCSQCGRWLLCHIPKMEKSDTLLLVMQTGEQRLLAKAIDAEFSPDGRELIFVDNSNTITRLELTPRPTGIRRIDS